MRIVLGVQPSSPPPEQDWPERGLLLADWLDGAVDGLHRLVNQYKSRPCVDSLAWFDEHTVVAQESRRGAAGAWFARLTLGGAAEFLRSLSVLYAGVRDVPLTRGYAPLVRELSPV